MEIDHFENLTEKELLAAYCKIESILKKRGIINKNNLVGSYGEHLAAKHYKFDLAENVNNRGFDGKDKAGKTYQVKTLRSSTSKGYYTVYNGFKLRKDYHFDYAICISLDPNFNINLMVKIPHSLVKKYASFNGGLTLSLDLVNEPDFKIHPLTKPYVRNWLIDKYTKN